MQSETAVNLFGDLWALNLHIYGIFSFLFMAGLQIISMVWYNVRYSGFGKEGQTVSTFQEIYTEYGRKIYRFLLSLSGSETLAEELLQETFFQALQHIGQFEGRCSLFTWLCQIGKNAWLKEVRRNKRYSEISLDDISLPEESPLLEEKVIRKDEYLRARKAMLALDEPYRNVFILHALCEIKLKEIADLYGKTESWARVTYFRARMQIVEEVTK